MRTANHARLIAAAAVACSIALPSSTEAQMPDDRTRLGAHFALAVAGDANISIGNLNTEASLDPTVGGALRLEVPLHDYFVLGGFFEIVAFEWDGPGAEREPVFNFDLLLKGRYVIEISRDVGVEPYLGVLVGPSIAILDNGGDEAWPGWNIGVVGGAAMLFDPAGFFVELGWRFHQVFNEATGIGGGDVDLQVNTNQFAMQIGGFVRL